MTDLPSEDSILNGVSGFRFFCLAIYSYFFLQSFSACSVIIKNANISFVLLNHDRLSSVHKVSENTYPSPANGSGFMFNGFSESLFMLIEYYPLICRHNEKLSRSREAAIGFSAWLALFLFHFNVTGNSPDTMSDI